MAASASSPAASQPAPPPARAGAGKPRRKHLKWIIAAIVLVAAAVFGYRYWRQESLFESTDDAYVGANQAEVAAQVAGPVLKVYVRDHQAVKAGDALFDIDPENYELAVERSRAQLDLARQSTSQA